MRPMTERVLSDLRAARIPTLYTVERGSCQQQSKAKHGFTVVAKGEQTPTPTRSYYKLIIFIC